MGNDDSPGTIDLNETSDSDVTDSFQVLLESLDDWFEHREEHSVIGRVDGTGKLTVGTQYADKDVFVVVNVLEE